jgi:hypothetical protein
MDGGEFFKRRMEFLAAGDVDSLVVQYASDAEIVRFLGVARGHEEIRAYLVGFLTAHQSYKLVSLDQMQHSDDSLIWEATVDTAAGPIQVYDVFVFDGSGKVSREFPGIQGYWGSS